MDEKLKFRREIILKVLLWGTAVHLFIVSYSVNQSSLFELKVPEQQLNLWKAKEKQADQLEKEAEHSSSPRQAFDIEKLKVEAAQIRLDVLLAKEAQDDHWYRAVGLVFGVLIYSMGYPLGIWFVYKRTDPEASAIATEKDLVPLWVALIYGSGMSLATLYVAVSTAYR